MLKVGLHRTERRAARPCGRPIVGTCRVRALSRQALRQLIDIDEQEKDWAVNTARYQVETGSDPGAGQVISGRS